MRSPALLRRDIRTLRYYMQPSSATQSDAQNAGHHHGVSAANAASDLMPVAINAVNLDADRIGSLDCMLDAAAPPAAQDGMCF